MSDGARDDDDGRLLLRGRRSRDRDGRAVCVCVYGGNRGGVMCGGVVGSRVCRVCRVLYCRL